MARTPKAAPAAKPTTALANWKEEMKAAADVAAETEAGTGGGSFFSLKSGILKFNDTILPGNEMVVVVLDHVLENIYYGDHKYDPDNPASPVCYAFGRTEADQAPPAKVDTEEAFERQHEQCKGCQWNEYGSASEGRGKACKNQRRLAMIPAGTYDKKSEEYTLFEDESVFAEAELAYMKIPVMSVKGWGTYVKGLAATLERPPFGVFTRVYMTPDDKSQFRVNFEALGEVPDELMALMLKRHKEAKELIEFDYTPRVPEEERAPSRSSNKLRSKAPAKRH